MKGLNPVHWRRQAGLFRGGLDGESTPLPEDPGPGWDDEDAFSEPVPTPAQKRLG